MANPSKAKGTRAESKARDWLQANGWPECERQPLRGNRDQGDLIVCRGPKIIAEVKYRAMPVGPRTLADWLEQTETEAVHAGADLGVLIVAVKGKPPALWDAYMPAADWALLTTGDSIPTRDAPEPLRATLAGWSRMAWDWADAQ